MQSPTEDKQWATKYLLDPLTAPGPSEETGPGTHFTSSVNRATPASKTPTVTTYPTPPTSASPTHSTFHPSNPFSAPHRQAAFGDYTNTGSTRRSLDEPMGNGKGRRRGSSLGERFPGDMSHRPLDQLRREAKAAHRSPHLKKRHLPGPDIIDSLDKTMFGTYHHEGPYDATLLARNTSYKHSPVEAVRESNREALRATPKENIRDAVERHMPLQGTAVIPPGMAGIDGRVMQYEEGADLMREPDAAGGAYKRWDHVKYLPEDYKGKGEPSYSIEKALKDHNQSHRRHVSEGNSYEMQSRRPTASRQRSVSGSNADLMRPAKSSGSALKSSNIDGDVRRHSTTGKRVGEGLKRRWGSLRGKKHQES